MVEERGLDSPGKPEEENSVTVLYAPNGTRTNQKVLLLDMEPNSVVITISSLPCVPAGSPSRGGGVAAYVPDKNQPSLPPPFFLFCSCVCFCRYSPLNCISFHKFSRQLSAFSLCSCGLISAVLDFSTLYLFMKVSLSPEIIICG